MLAGAGTGLLLGALVGLSVSAVVGSVVGGVVALLATFLGLKDDAGAGSTATAEETIARRLGVGVFGLACVAGVIGGLAMRTHDVLAMSPKQQVAQWKDAGYPEPEARGIVALKVAGLVPKDATVQKRSPTEEGGGTVLFGADVRFCDTLRPDDYSGAANLGEAFANAGGAWAAYGRAVANVRDTTARFPLLRAAWGLVCR